MKESEIKAKGFSKGDIGDAESIGIFIESLNKSFIKPQVSENDKTPNTDGLLWILDNERIPIGKIEVQVKTISTNYETPSKNLELPVLAYIRDCQLPFLLILVDPNKKLWYWREIKRNDARELINKAIDKKDDQKTIAVHCKIENVFPANDPYETWKGIVNEHIKLIQSTSEIKEKYLLAKEELDKLAVANSEKDRNPNYIHINIFLDKLNSLFNNEFSIIKKLFVREFWKFGISLFGDTTNQHVTFSLFSIEADENSKQIFSYPSNKSLFEFMNQRKGQIYTMSGFNPFFEKPNAFAFEKIWDYLKLLLDRDIIWPDAELLQQEYLFFIRDYHFKELGFEEVETLHLEDFKRIIEQRIEILPEFEMSRMKDYPDSEFNLFRALNYIQNMRLEGKDLISRIIPSRNTLLEIVNYFNQYGNYPENTEKVLENYHVSLVEGYNSVVKELFPEIQEYLINEPDGGLRIIAPVINRNFQSGRFVLPCYEEFEIDGSPTDHFERIYVKDDTKIIFNHENFTLEYLDKIYKLRLVRTEGFPNSKQMTLRYGIFELLRKKLEQYFKARMQQKD